MAFFLNGPTDADIIEAAHTKQKAQLAHASIVTAAQIYIMLRRWRIQEQYIKIAEEQRNHYKSVFRPLEDQELRDALQRFEKDTRLEDVIDHITNSLVAYRLQSTGMEYRAIENISEYHTGMLKYNITQAQINDVIQATYAKIIGEFKRFSEEQNRLDGGIAALTQALARGRSLGAEHLSLATVNSDYLKALNFEYDYAEPVTELNDQRYIEMGLVEKYNNNRVLPVPPKEATWGYN